MRSIALVLICGTETAFNPRTTVQNPIRKFVEESREQFVSNLVGWSVLSTLPTPAQARGRATLEQSYERYAPRIVAGGKFLATDFRKMVEKNDWAGLKAATSDPPAKTKADRSKPDGGVTDRAAQAGYFSDARVLVAADLLAGAFSDSSISDKTRNIKGEVAMIREAVQGINTTAREALGEDVGGGGFFGLGPKKSQAELSKSVREQYVKAGTSYNKCVFLINAELPLSLAKLPYIS